MKLMVSFVLLLFFKLSKVDHRKYMDSIIKKKNCGGF